MPYRSRRAWSAFARGALVVFLVVAALQAARSALRGFVGAARAAGETPLDTRQRVLGAEYADAIEHARRVIAPGDAYVLVDAGTYAEAARFWVRHDLAPRRPRFIGFAEGLSRRPERARRTWPRAAKYAVVARPDYQAPLVLERGEFLAWVEGLHADR
jgi:hypothetical protein